MYSITIIDIDNFCYPYITSITR